MSLENEGTELTALRLCQLWLLWNELTSKDKEPVVDLDSRFASEFSALVKRGGLVFTPSIAVRREGGEKEPSQPFLQFVCFRQTKKEAPTSAPQSSLHLGI